jgi:GNAT superfamily N-acetyltransferase
MSSDPQSNAGRETGVRISTDPAELDLDWLVPALSERAYWAAGRSRAIVEASIRASLCFGAYDDTDGGRQVGFARVVTDQAVYGWVCDVFVDESVRGRGVGSALMAAITSDPRLADCRLVLSTRTASELYARYGFQPLAHPELMMERPRRPADDGGPG